MTTPNILKMALLLVGLGFFFMIGLETVVGASSWDDPVSTVNNWMTGDGNESHHMMGHQDHDHEHDDDYHEEYHGNDHEEHHEFMHDDEAYYEIGHCHRP